MGIKNLMKIIHQFAPDSIKYTTISNNNYKNTTMAVDANLLLYKMIFAIRKNGYDLKNGDTIVTHIYTLLQKLIGFIKYKITPVFVFDGIPPKIKEATLKERKAFHEFMKKKYQKATTQDEQKKYYYMKSDITYEEIQQCRELISIFGFPIIDAPEEADSQLAYLSKKNLVDFIISDDMDILIFGGKKLLKNFTVSEQKKIQEIELKQLLKNLKITQEQLIDIGILVGCDYCSTIKGIGPVTAYELIQKHHSIKQLIKKKIIGADTSYQIVHEYFKNPEITKVKKITSQKIDKEKLINFLTKLKYRKKFIQKILTSIS